MKSKEHLLVALRNLGIALRESESPKYKSPQACSWGIYGRGAGERAYTVSVDDRGYVCWSVTKDGKRWASWMRSKGATVEFVLGKLEQLRGWASKAEPLAA